MDLGQRRVQTRAGQGIASVAAASIANTRKAAARGQILATKLLAALVLVCALEHGAATRIPFGPIRLWRSFTQRSSNSNDWIGSMRCLSSPQLTHQPTNDPCQPVGPGVCAIAQTKDAWARNLSEREAQ